MRVLEKLSSFADAVLPEDTGSYADNLLIESNLCYGLSGFMAEQIYKAVEQGTALVSPDTMILSASGIVLGGVGIYLRERARCDTN